MTLGCGERQEGREPSFCLTCQPSFFPPSQQAGLLTELTETRLKEQDRRRRGEELFSEWMPRSDFMAGTREAWFPELEKVLESGKDEYCPGAAEPAALWLHQLMLRVQDGVLVPWWRTVDVSPQAWPGPQGGLRGVPLPPHCGHLAPSCSRSPPPPSTGTMDTET